MFEAADLVISSLIYMGSVSSLLIVELRIIRILCAFVTLMLMAVTFHQSMPEIGLTK